MLNYGLNKLRFPAALPVGDRVLMGTSASARSTTCREGSW